MVQMRGASTYFIKVGNNSNTKLINMLSSPLIVICAYKKCLFHAYACKRMSR